MGQLKRQGRIRIKPGDPFPRLALISTTGRKVDLADEAALNHLVLFFYPGDQEGLRYPELMGCTPEACAFRDRLHELRALGAVVFGVSLQATERQQQFAKREHLTFELLSDERQRLVRALRIPVWSSKAGEKFAARTTLVVKKGGRLAHIFEEVEVQGHVDAVIEALRGL